MRALTVVPGDPASARLTEIAEPPADEGEVLVQTSTVGICGTDTEIVEFGYGSPPEGDKRLVIGHEAVGRVVDAPSGSGFESGDLVVGIVRVPDPVPCECCAAGEWDMCRNGLFTERGIKGRHGFGRERYRIDATQLIKVDGALGERAVLLEPTSVVAKAWEHALHIDARACFTSQVAVVTGAGPIGLLAAMLSVQHGRETHVVDPYATGSKPDLVRALGATFHPEPVSDIGVAADVVLECTGLGQVAIDAMDTAAANAVIALVGISMGTHVVQTDANAINNSLVMTNSAIFGSVNAARRHYEQAANALVTADPDWLDRLVTRRVTPDEWTTGLKKQPGDIKVVIDMQASSP